MSGTVDLRGAEVLLTGATGGLGHAIARALAARGARLLLTGRRAEVLEPLAAEVGGRAVSVDLADRDAVAGLVEQAGAVDVLIANAALPGSGRLEAYTAEQADRVLEVNLRAPVALCHALVPGMAARGRGQVVLVSSLAGKAASPSSSLYSATKFGLRGFGLGLRADLEAGGVGVTTVLPGFIREAGMFHEAGTKLPRGVGTRTPADVAAAVVRAVDEDPAEIDVAPLGLRAGAAFSGLAPGLAATIARRLGAGAVSEQLSGKQRDKR